MRQVGEQQEQERRLLDVVVLVKHVYVPREACPACKALLPTGGMFSSDPTAADDRMFQSLHYSISRDRGDQQLVVFINF